MVRRLLFLALVVFFPLSLQAQIYGTDFHTVTVTVQPIAVLQVTSGTVNLTIDGSTAVAGQDQMTVIDQTTSLLWGVNSSNQKITVASSLVSPMFALKLAAVSPTQGVAAPEVTLNAVTSDLLLGIGRSSGSCTLRYTGVALASQGTGSDPHSITFTIVAQ